MRGDRCPRGELRRRAVDCPHGSKRLQKRWLMQQRKPGVVGSDDARASRAVYVVTSPRVLLLCVCVCVCVCVTGWMRRQLGKRRQQQLTILLPELCHRHRHRAAV